MKMIELVKQHLKDGGFDGLCLVDGECGCLLDYLHPCGESFADCEPGYKCDDPDSPGDWMVCKVRPNAKVSGVPPQD